MISGVKTDTRFYNENQADATRTFTDYIMAKEFGWTPDEIAVIPQNIYNDYLTIISIINAKQNAQQEKRKPLKTR